MNREKKEANKINGKKYKIAIITAKFNEDITAGMLVGAIKVLKENGVAEKNIATVLVPGAFEIPLRAQQLAQTKRFDGIIVLGCVIKGDTDHYFYVAGESISGVMDVMLKTGVPIGMGIITTNNLKQAKDRSGVKNNKGGEAAQAVLEMIG